MMISAVLSEFPVVKDLRGLTVEIVESKERNLKVIDD